MRFFDNLNDYNGGAGTPAEVWSYTYDAFGREVEVVQTPAGGPSRTVQTAYDAQGRIISESKPEGIITYAYDEHGRRTETAVYLAGGDPSIDDPQRTTSYTYDDLARLETVIEDRDFASTEDELLTTTYQYDLVGNLDATLLPNDVIEDYEYDELNRLDVLTTFIDDGIVNGVYDDGSDTLIAQYDYTVSDDGRRTGLVETFETSSGTLTNTWAWDYDKLGRLIEEELDSTDNSLDFVTTYEFDLTGNRREKSTAGGETITYQYDANDRLLVETSSTGVVTTYDYHLTQQTEKTVTQTDNSSVVTTFAYDLQGRMSEVIVETRNTSGTPTSRERSTFDYDANGFRVFVKHEIDATADDTYETSTTTEYLADANNHTGYTQTVRETTRDDTGTVTKTVDYSFGHDEISQNVAEYNAQGKVTSVTLHFFGHDGHGSVRVLINEQAGVAEVYHYDAYGNAIGFDPAVALTKILYSGESFNAQVNQHYLRARWYDAASGRFNRLDPFFGHLDEPQSLHKYLYTSADPVNGIDPSGLFTATTSTTTTTTASSLATTQLQSVLLSLVVSGRVIELAKLRYQYNKLTEVATRVNARVSTKRQVEQERDRNRNYRYFAHGSSTGAWLKGDVIGIDPRVGRPGDFGIGFYTFKADVHGLIAAEKRGIQARDWPGNGGMGFVLVVRMLNADFNSLSRRHYGTPQRPAPGYSADVAAFRRGLRPQAGFDVIIGPTAKRDGATGTWVPNTMLPVQYKFETMRAVTKLRPVIVYPVFTDWGGNIFVDPPMQA